MIILDGSITIIIPIKPIITASQQELFTSSFNKKGDSTTVINGEKNKMIVASANVKMDKEVKKKYVINNKATDLKT